MMHDLMFAVVGLDDAFYAAVISALIGAGAQAAQPKTSMKTPGEVPQGDNAAMNFQQLVGQQRESELKKLSLEDRLPPPEQFY